MLNMVCCSIVRDLVGATFTSPSCSQSKFQLSSKTMRLRLLSTNRNDVAVVAPAEILGLCLRAPPLPEVCLLEAKTFPVQLQRTFPARLATALSWPWLN